MVRDIYRRFGWPGWSDTDQQQQNNNNNSDISTSNGTSGSGSDSTSSSQSMEFKVGCEAKQGIGAAASSHQGSQKREGVITTGAKEEKDNKKSYARNVHRPLPAGIRAVLDDRWGNSFHRLGYAKGHVLHKNTKTGVTTFTGSTAVGK